MRPISLGADLFLPLGMEAEIGFGAVGGRSPQDKSGDRFLNRVAPRAG